MIIDLSKIHPKVHSRYSPNLHKWLKFRTKGAAAFLLQHIKIYRHDNQFLYIGHKDDDSDTWLHGSRLNQVLCVGSRAEVWAYSGMGHAKEIPGFWEDYERIGRCAIDTEHKTYFTNDPQRWTANGNHRDCLWCGNHRQVLETKVLSRTVEIWTPITAAAA